ncbi:flagellar basal-body rod protein FlgF [Rossellomorea vietnamensis]|uniref:Flagellar basal-body rod protein FlgF n=2 Tax=Rossellomorea vietnamensis TaxID=218284 RepID=A0A5D4KKR4_9BACI|nr:flagellar basal-body rod protein FlgF [Rossellomorea vietnamensis]
MYSGISGMKNFQTKLDVIGNNIANVNTYGFKKGRVTFKDTMNQTISGASAAQENRGGKNPMQVGLGSTLSTIDTIHTQSSLQSTGRPLDLAINGDGYFVVKQGDAQFYSRAGNFYLDDSGTLVNGDGLKVQSYENGVLQDIKVNVNAQLPATITETINMFGNLSSDAVGSEPFVQQINVVDDTGEQVTLDMKLTPQNPSNKWDLQFVNQNGENPLTSDSYTIDFSQDPMDAPPFVNLPISDTNEDGTADTLLNVEMDYEQLTNLGGDLSASADPDGNTAGSLESFNIGSMGEINGVYSNGEITTIGYLALAKFSNPSGLTKAGGNSFQQSVNSGPANVNIAGEGRGSIVSGSLEMSNVDLSEEFTEMITAQRGFQANTKIITTSDEILQELVNLKR